ncbi:MAG: 2-oxo acid dehydrogenase subunit E2 [Aquabacterium sp.]|uniref:2-oxo acid dehydrogenase subunit E2 n=1 Tax=Aquabacterium sp. TaxID=1872578 RepID=UPI0025BA8125|nr:2-oxo acid dehydrogenase subunit E2 [Aquabacterium sp.]MBI5925015.1 2-oxo acid dehydrogenase subunit E2 [Aquabacterium sp.]
MLKTVAAPRINTNDDKLEVVAWHVLSGAVIEPGQDVVDVETSKAVVTIQAEDAGYIRPLHKAPAVVRVGEPLYLVSESLSELDQASSVVTLTSTPDVRSEPFIAKRSPGSSQVAGQLTSVLREGRAVSGSTPVRFDSTRFSKKASQLLAERGMSEAEFDGRGLVTAAMLDSTMLSRRSQASVPSLPVSGDAEFTQARMPVTPRQVRVSQSKQAEISALSLGENGNVNSNLTVYFDSLPIRNRLKAEHAFDGNIQPVILFELSRLLKDWPQLTAYFFADEVHFYDRIDLGLAFDLGKGLKVVSLPEADRMTPVAFFESTLDIGMRYLENKIRPEEMSGSTFTVTDLSGFDVLHFHPLINGAQSAILGIGGDSTKSQHPMSLTLTFDHRVTNGRDVAQFLGALRERVLSYAPPVQEVIDPASSRGALRVTVCDRCGVGIGQYYRDFQKDGYLTAYIREDGTLGGVCHRCVGGWA